MKFAHLFLAALLLAALPAVQALEPTFAVRVAIHGYDTVAYFTQSKPVPGTPQYSFKWQQATWFFATPEHRDQFKKEPQKYAPQYGGYCAYAISNNSTAKIDPQAWTIVADKLYLNYNAKIQQRWLQNRDGRIAQADKNWPGLLNQDP
ncbi:MAG: YHS domain protein [Candidatus Latescibacteria bacterium]|nr:YHS domain protein [Candidatus Latescibacterota bacterium]